MGKMIFITLVLFTQGKSGPYINFENLAGMVPEKSEIYKFSPLALLLVKTNGPLNYYP